MDYYVSLLGDDSNVGTSETAPWRTIKRVNAAPLLPGDSVLFQANQTFLGNLCFVDKYMGRVNKPITVSSYGFGRATIDAGEGAGCIVKNRGGSWDRPTLYLNTRQKGKCYAGFCYRTSMGRGEFSRFH